MAKSVMGSPTFIGPITHIMATGTATLECRREAMLFNMISRFCTDYLFQRSEQMRTIRNLSLLSITCLLFFLSKCSTEARQPSPVCSIVFKIVLTLRLGSVYCIIRF